MTMTIIGVGIAGYGMATKTFHIPLIGVEKRMELRAIASKRAETVTADIPSVAICADVDELVARRDVNLVVVAGRNANHFSQCKTALLGGKHVVVEKPMTVTSDEANELIAISESQNVVLSVFHNRRWDNGTLALESLLRDRTIGAPTVCSLRFDRFVPEVRDRWREQALPGSGTLYDLGSHLLFAALTLFGMPESLYADLAIQRPGGVVHDFFDISLTYDTLRVQLRSSLLMRSNDLVIEGHGEKGSFVKYGMDPQEAMLKAGLTPGMDAWNDHESDNTYSLTIVDQGTEIQGVPSGTYAEFYAGVADAILDGSPPPISAGQARDCISLIEKSLESAKSGQRITL